MKRRRIVDYTLHSLAVIAAAIVLIGVIGFTTKTDAVYLSLLSCENGGYETAYVEFNRAENIAGVNMAVSCGDRNE